MRRVDNSCKTVIFEEGNHQRVRKTPIDLQRLITWIQFWYVKGKTDTGFAIKFYAFLFEHYTSTGKHDLVQEEMPT